jgi:hypothetical protein
VDLTTNGEKESASKMMLLTESLSLEPAKRNYVSEAVQFSDFWQM